MKKHEQQNGKYEIGFVTWGNVRRYQYINHLTDEQLAEILEISTRTLYTYDKEPSTIKLETLQNFIDSTKMEISELIVL